MRIALTIFAGAVAAMLAGCAGPEQKLGRGINNVTEFARMGEIRRSVEQTSLWEGSGTAATTGFIRGFNRSIARTFVGVYEVVTFPLPPFKAVLTPKSRIYPDPSIATTKYPYGGLAIPEHKVYPDSYAPNILADQIFATDTSLGFSGGDVAPFIIGSRFRIFDN